MLQRKFSKVRVDNNLTLGKNAVLKVTNTDNTESTINILELAALDGIAAADLAKIDGITNGTGVASKALVLDSSGNVAMPATGLIGLSRAALAAAGTDATNGGAVATQVVAVTASDGTKGVVLPAAATTTGPILILNTVLTSGANLKVYPVNGGNDNINGEAEDAAFTMGPGAAAWFVPTSATQWYVADKSGVLTTKAEDNILDGVTATATELNYLDITTLGTGAASKAIVLDASGDYTFPAAATIVMPSGGDMTFASGSTLDVAGTFEIANVAVTASAAELNYNDISSLGTGAASKAVVLDAGEDYTWPNTGVLTLGVLATAVEAAEHGAGAIGTAATPKTYRWIEHGVIVTQTTFDLTGLASVATANDVIGLAAGGAAYIGRNVEATNGVIFKVEFSCLETPTTGDNDVNVVANASASLAYDGAGGTAYLSNSGDLLKGQTIQNLLPGLTEGDYFYLTAGTGDTAGTYASGMYVLTTYGHAVLA